jgi:hypothetical protein
MKYWFSLLLNVALCSTACGSPFVNLGFDLANTNNLLASPPQFGLGTGGTQVDMLLGWRLTGEEHELSWLVALSIGLDVNAAGLGYATLVDGRYGRPGALSAGLVLPFEGRFSLALYPFDFPPVYIAYRLSQSGDVPADARRIQFLNYGEPFELRLNGSLVPLTYDYRLIDIWEGRQQLRVARVTGDVSAYAGSTVLLEFRTLNEFSNVGDPPPPSPGFGALVNGIDSVSFVVPEPSTWLLLSAGAVGLLAGHRLRLRRDRTRRGP